MGELISGIGSIIGGNQAAGAAKKAADNNWRQYLITRQDLNPFTTAGQAVLPDLVSLAQSGQQGGGTNYLAQAAGMQPGQMTQAELEATPGYQFNLSQGLKATQSAAAARGLGVSGAALKGAATYATGLADSTYQNQFNNAQQRFMNSINLNTAQQGNLTNQYNRLTGVANLGEGAAAQTGAIGASLSNAVGNFLTQGGIAQALGTQGFANGLGSTANMLLGPTSGGLLGALSGAFSSGGGTQGFTGVGVGGRNNY